MEKLKDHLTKTQQSFLIWNAERLGITYEESIKRYLFSWKSINGGHYGQDFRSFNNLSYELYSVFFNDTNKEVYAAYQHHSYMHFLRMLSYHEPSWDDNNLVVKNLLDYSNIDILDYGCGLAQSSRTLGEYLKIKGKTVRLYLVDIPTMRKDFLLWLGKTNKIEINFIDCTENNPMPYLPECNICIATEFFEHVFEPLKYFQKIHAALRPGGILITNVADHEKEFMHVSPDLQAIRNVIEDLKYKIITKNKIFKKIF